MAIAGPLTPGQQGRVPQPHAAASCVEVLPGSLVHTDFERGRLGPGGMLLNSCSGIEIPSWTRVYWCKSKYEDLNTSYRWEEYPLRKVLVHRVFIKKKLFWLVQWYKANTNKDADVLMVGYFLTSSSCLYKNTEGPFNVTFNARKWIYSETRRMWLEFDLLITWVFLFRGQASR